LLIQPGKTVEPFTEMPIGGMENFQFNQPAVLSKFIKNALYWIHRKIYLFNRLFESDFLSAVTANEYASFLNSVTKPNEEIL